MRGEIINKVANSGLISLDFEEYLPQENVLGIDLKDFLFMERIIKEKDFREQMKLLDWQQYENKHVFVFCSIDAIIPTWAYMLISLKLSPYALNYVIGKRQDLFNKIVLEKISDLDFSQFKDQRVVIKGCSKESLAPELYSEITKKLLPFAKSIMFGEPCSTVPIFKRKK